MEQYLFLENVAGNNVLPTGQGPAIFSTDRGRNPAREAFNGQRREVRSDRNEAIVTTASDLRAKFPLECISLRPEDVEQRGPVLNKYFDNFDIYFYSPRFLWDVLLYIAKTNQASKAERMNDVEDFVNGWINANKEAFHLITAEHQWYDLFTPEDIEEYEFEFLWDAFWKIAHIREHHGTHTRPSCYNKQADKDDFTQTMLYNSGASMGAAIGEGKQLISLPPFTPTQIRQPQQTLRFHAQMFTLRLMSQYQIR
ncbi:MAG: hypothetical protein Q9163_004159 [Psora crenata]